MSDLPPAPESSRNPVSAGDSGRHRFAIALWSLDTVDPFGGVGLMIDRPETDVVVRGSREFQCSGPTANVLSGLPDGR